ncbi:hypothetical protein Tco_1580631, partial [Tanacetum coccineum]
MQEGYYPLRQRWLPLTRPLTSGQQPLTGGPVVVQRWLIDGLTLVNGGAPPLTIVDHHRWTPLTVWQVRQDQYE